MTKETYTIDASGRSIGRVASEVAVYLLGKKTPDLKKHLVKDMTVNVINAGKLKITPKKMRTKTYTSYSGYPGGLKKPTMALVMEKKGIEEVLKHAVRGMLPKNKLQDKRMMNITVTV